MSSVSCLAFKKLAASPPDAGHVPLFQSRADALVGALLNGRVMKLIGKQSEKEWNSTAVSKS
ncbi:hypothetical protein F1880_000322 [Penicillium rolfsii]|nr:hypothetical protein F1880_000322 [Penicillium rolfsii]